MKTRVTEAAAPRRSPRASRASERPWLPEPEREAAVIERPWLPEQERDAAVIERVWLPEHERDAAVIERLWLPEHERAAAVIERDSTSVGRLPAREPRSSGAHRSGARILVAGLSMIGAIAASAPAATSRVSDSLVTDTPGPSPTGAPDPRRASTEAAGATSLSDHGSSSSRAAAVGMMGTAAWELLRPYLDRRRWLHAAVIAGASLVLSLRFDMPPIEVLALAAVAGLGWRIPE